MLAEQRQWARLWSLVLNLPLARAYHEAFLRMKEELGLTDAVTLSMIASQRDVMGAGCRISPRRAALQHAVRQHDTRAGVSARQLAGKLA